MKSRKHLHLQNLDYRQSGFVYFLTICTAERRQYFTDPKLASIVTDAMLNRRMNGEIQLFCYCIMPDHLHMLVSLDEAYQKSLQNWVSAFKRHTSRAIGNIYEVRPLWQKNFYDHVVRKEESLVQTIEYIIHNPVRKQLVARWDDYPYTAILDPLPI